MAYNFSANQFDNAFKAQRLCNWEVPKWYPPRPRQRKFSTKIIANDRGHLLPSVKRSDDSPWGHFKGTHQLPKKISRETANDINRKLTGKYRWSQFEDKSADSPNDELVHGSYRNSEKKFENTKSFLDTDLNPSDTPYEQQHPSFRDYLLQQSNDLQNDIKIDTQIDTAPKEELKDFSLNQHEYKIQQPPSRRQSASTTLPNISNPNANEEVENNFEKMHLSAHRSITEKPHERSPSPVIPAYANFQMARKMHQENLDHQPLPDCVADKAFRKLQAEGIAHPGLALNMNPIATGVGVKTYNAGPTHCTKMKVFRPKTCGVVPKAYNDDGVTPSHRPFSSLDAKKMGSMDLAICWDYRPDNPADEPKLARHIDGSNDSAGPAVFTFVKTPRTPEKTQTGRSAGVFTSTFGEPGFFDKDIMRRKTDFAQAGLTDHVKCTCGTSPTEYKNGNNSRAKSVSRGGSCTKNGFDHKRYQSSPNLSQFKIGDFHKENQRPSREHSCSKYGPKKSESQPGFFRRTARMCHKVAPQPYLEDIGKEDYKAAFLAGLPKSNAAGKIGGCDSGCSSMSGGSFSNTNKVLVVPRPRNPYNKKNYDIETLVPPFTSLKGGAGQGGYPEHWRLASVYQHAYKPLEQRKRPLLQTVYK